MWSEPKTDWRPDDCFLLEPDYERLRRNLEFLARQAAAVRVRPQFAPLLTVTVEDVPTPDFFNRTEQAAQALSLLLEQPYQPHPEFRAGDRVWNWQDLNRLEQLCSQVEQHLKTVKNGQPVLAFTLGGNCFEPTI